jgi:hypothetical protein
MDANRRKTTRRSRARLACCSDSLQCATKCEFHAAVVFLSMAPFRLVGNNGPRSMQTRARRARARPPPPPPAPLRSIERLTRYSAFIGNRAGVPAGARSVRQRHRVRWHHRRVPFRRAPRAHVPREHRAARHADEPTARPPIPRRAHLMLPGACWRLPSATSRLLQCCQRLSVACCVLHVACAQGRAFSSSGLRFVASVATLSFASGPVATLPPATLSVATLSVATLHRGPLQRRQLQRLNGAHSPWRRAAPAFRRAAADRARRGALLMAAKLHIPGILRAAGSRPLNPRALVLSTPLGVPLRADGVLRRR